MKRARICSVLAIIMVLLMVSGSAAVLRDQEEYTPDGTLEEVNTDRSQVYVDGEGYFVDSEQKVVHEETEQFRQEQFQQNPVQVNPTVQIGRAHV